MRRLWLLPAVVLLLSACSVEPRDELRGDVEAVTLAANDGDAAGVRDAVAELRSTIRRQVAGGDLERGEGERLNAIALAILENAALLEAAPTPTPTPEEPEPEPTPTPEEPSPTPTPEEPEPEETEEEPEPVETEVEPEPEPEPTLVVEPLPEETPSQQAQAASTPQSTPSS